jgi:TolB-like protein
MSFWRELKRRKVGQVAAVYAVTAWLLVQIVATVEQPLNLPDWVDTLVILLLAIGFPIALILSWAFDLTPDGLVREDESRGAAPRSDRRLGYPLLVVLLLAAGVLAVGSYWRGSRGTGDAAVPKIAVLPCENLGDPSEAYFVEGMHEEILRRLAQLSGLLVLARSSVQRYVDQRFSMAQIATELDAQAIMECSVRYAGDDILVEAHLIDPATGARVFSIGPESGNLSDLSRVFATQARIALGIANAVGARYTPAEAARIEVEQTESGQAYKLYLQANGLNRARALGLLQEAIALDPHFAAAHAALALTYAFALGNTDGGAAVPAAERSRFEDLALDHAATAIDIDPDTPDAYTARAVVANANWRWTEAEQSYARAVDVGTYSQVAFNAYGVLLSILDRHEEAIALAELARTFDPVDPNAGWYAFQLGYAGRYDQAAEVFERAIEGAPQNLLLYHWLAYMEIARGHPDTAIGWLVSAERLAGENRVLALLSEWAYAYARAGRGDDARRIVEELERAAKDGAEPGAGGWAMAYLAIGDEAHALEQLEIAAAKAARHEQDEGIYNLYNLKMNVTNDTRVLTKPEFVSVLARIQGD